MSAKEYLSKLRNWDIMIRHKQIEADELKILATSTGGMGASEPVKTSKTGDALERKILKYVDLENEIDRDIDQLIDMRHKIIEQIHQLDDSKYIELLFKRYVEYKSFEKIAVEMYYEYQTIRKMHGDALAAFEELINTNQHSDVVLC